MKIFLINPPITQTEVYSKYAAGAPYLPPLGLCYLAAMLLEKGYETQIIDCAAEKTSFDELRQKIRIFKPDLVGVTSTTVSYTAAQKVFRAIKEIDDTIITVLGGVHISALPSQTISECQDVDIGVYGEGEFTLKEIVERLERKQSFTDVDGVIVRNNGAVVQNKPRSPIKNLDVIPFPARHLLKDLRVYSHTPFRGARCMTTMITSRGCPFRCGYCDQSISGRAWRAHSPEYVIEEIDSLMTQYNVNFISFEDDNFLLSKKRTLEICQMILKHSFNIAWSCLGRADEVDGELLSVMKRAGCHTIYLGIESGSPRILELINKNIRLEGIQQGIRLIKKHGIHLMGSFVIGIPSETKDDIEKTINFALSLPLDGISLFMFTPYPNTPLRDLAFQHGKVSKKWENYSGHPGSLSFIPNGLDEEYLLRVQTELYKRFLLRPGYLLKHLGTLANRQTFVKGVRFLKALMVK